MYGFLFVTGGIGDTRTGKATNVVRSYGPWYEKKRWPDNKGRATFEEFIFLGGI